MKVNFLYGDEDWMDRDAADELINAQRLKNFSTVTTIPDAGHNLLVDNPSYVAICLYGLVFGSKVKPAYQRKLELTLNNRRNSQKYL